MTVKARDREVIVNSNGYINYSKLMESITGDRRSFAGVCRKNSCLYKHIFHHDKAKLEAWAEQELKKTKKSKVGAKDPTFEIDVFMRTVTVNLISMTKSLFKYIHESIEPVLMTSLSKYSRYNVDTVIEPVIIYTNGLSISAISKNMQPLILYNQDII